MRTTADRIRHAISFEVLAIILSAPLASAIFGVPVFDFGVIAISTSTIAMGWNYVYNLGFDHALRRLGLSLKKTLPMRILHAVLFEVGLLMMLVPLVAWYLEITLMRALVMDLFLSAFYMSYAFAFNWAYDLIFPIPEEPGEPAV